MKILEIIMEAGKASRILCKSTKPDSELGASQLSSCKSQGFRARDTEKQFTINKKRKSIKGKKVKGGNYGGPLPVWKGNGESVNEDWQKVNKKDKTDGMSSKAVKAYRNENPGSKLKTAVTTKPSKLDKDSKDAKRRSSFCARMGGMKKSNASAKTRRDPDSPINKALRRWNC
jgi:hypothetical protein